MIGSKQRWFAWLLPLAAFSASGGCGLTGDQGSGGGDASSRDKGTTYTGEAIKSGPRFSGFGVSYRPLEPGCGPATADTCAGVCGAGSAPEPTLIRPPATLCFKGELDATPDDPSAVIEQVIEEVDGRGVVHLRVTFDPSFVDNTYGAGACCGWPGDGDTVQPVDKAGAGKAGPATPVAGKAGKSGHTFEDLVGSDHLELLLTDGDGDTVMDFKIDYISEDASAPCGYRTLGVTGGEGKMISGDASAILDVATSIDRNLNGCGYCFTVDSPATDENYTINPDAPNWDYRVVYEVWIDLAAFGAAGFGQAYINNVHASPSKAFENTNEVESGPCPPDWDIPYCPPSVIEEGRNCFGEDGECPPNMALYIASEGRSSCTPIPFSGYPDMKPCPEGYALDPATEGRYCLPIAE